MTRATATRDAVVFVRHAALAVVTRRGQVADAGRPMVDARAAAAVVVSRLAAFVIAASIAACGSSERDPSRTEVRIRGHRIEAEVAADEATRSRGLMFRRALADNAGMLFVFPHDAPWSFWMEDTFVPLSLAFIDREHRIVQIDELEPFSKVVHAPSAPIRYALEVNQGWFARRGIGVGDVVELGLAP